MRILISNKFASKAKFVGMRLLWISASRVAGGLDVAKVSSVRQ